MHLTYYMSILKVYINMIFWFVSHFASDETCELGGEGEFVSLVIICFFVITLIKSY